MKKSYKYICIVGIIAFNACGTSDMQDDAYGNFEADEVTISALANGEIIQFNLSEGKHLDSGQILGLIDTTSLSLMRGEIDANKAAVVSKYQQLFSQLSVLKTQLNNLEKDHVRIANLVSNKAATQKQLDDIEGAIASVKSQQTTIESQNPTVTANIDAIDAKLKQLDYQIHQCTIRNPITGTVISKLAFQGEVTGVGKPIYTIAPLDIIYLKVWVDGATLPHIKISDKAEIHYDMDKISNSTTTGIITWISDEAEFTPKNIQTKEERTNQVYAVRISIKNNGNLKIGMPGSAVFTK